MLELTALGGDDLVRALQEAADRLSLGIAVFRVTQPERVLFASEMTARILGRSRAELEGGSPFDLLAPEKLATERQRLEERGRGEAAPISFETMVIRPDGTRVPIEIALTRVAMPDVALNVAFLRDISAQRTAIETLRHSEERFRRVVEGAPDGVVIVQRGRILFMNDLAATMFGIDATAVGTSVTDHILPEDAAIATQRIGAMLATGVSFEPREYRPKHVDRVLEIKSIVIDHEGSPAIVAFVRDVTARKRIERDLVRADRLASIGMMSAAVAHEINNPLTYVQLSLQYLERELAGSDPRILEQLRNASHGVDRVATIVRDLRTFARADDSEVGRVDAVGCLERALKIAGNDLRHRAQLVRDFVDVPPVHANASRLEQVFLNVLVNAAQAIPAGSPGDHEIAIVVRSTGDAVTIAIRDTGTGIAPEVRERLFEPFFSTKAPADGTGLGLAVCRSIVAQIGGEIAIESATPRGAVVTITLPVYRGEPVADPARAPTASVSSRRLRVLVVDDEPLVRRALSSVLGREHDVVLAEHGTHALEILAGATFDVIVCDLMMPVMNGKELYERVLARDPKLARRFVFITGGTLGALGSFFEGLDMPMLYKPFEVTEVLTCVAIAAAR